MKAKALIQVLIEPIEKREFKRFTKKAGSNPPDVLREFIKEYNRDAKQEAEKAKP